MIRYKFRAWDEIHKEMINWEQYKGEMVSNDFEDDDLIIMQWTGMKDDHGKDIYPGDIIHAEGHYPGVGWYDTGEHDYNFKEVVVWGSRELTYSCGGYRLSEEELREKMGGRIYGKGDIYKLTEDKEVANWVERGLIT